ncbi:GNAT family N-acetyltransferase [Amphritea sp. 2_MG-2023]|uniref:GNAT family N-acetyltransferase n=1 Tax=Amphritea TaxID=515417 RepID=UPI001C073CCA|nr:MULTISPECIES: GNAT family N-acetyltransferase [Amphritea]MBU2966452.1 GNAT family N-acetyltransferase [Amphritea atlantica]MDO6417689.1 GNAT family N-acetyltransferase [Amphritea sp. 2_MG-2023]
MPQFNFYSAIEQIGADHWNNLCHTDYPFLRYEYLHALEQSGSVAPKNGWQPCHLLVTEGEQAIAAMPLYLKNHSYGEYVFDWSWADAYQRNGLEYYPKLVTAIPFTPCYGPRLMLHADLSEAEQNRLTQDVISAVLQLASQHNASGWHGLFLTGTLLNKDQCPQLNYRLGTQYHWFNRDYQNFDDFLETFSSRKRKNLRKERTKITEQNIHHRFISGAQLTDEQLHQFYQFYQITYLKRGRNGYLNESFFRQLRDTLADQLHICFAYDKHYSETEAVAGALFFQDKDTLYGRYWGALAEYDSLHFETCYYQGIEHCIHHQLQRFDPGAQGEHKIQRGFEPIETWSSHWLAHPEFQQAVQRFTQEEEELVRQEMEQLRQRLPFKKE